jgi:hypothetical protein
MAGKVGTASVSDLFAARFTSLAKFGQDRVQSALQADLEVHNQLATEMVGSLAEVSSDRQRIYGTSDSGQMLEVDEFSRGPTQKPQVGATVAFPMRLFQYNVGWTRKFFQNKTVNDLLVMYLAAKKAHRRKIQVRLKKAIFGSANYTFNDLHVDKIDLAVKRFLNADSVAIPEGPNGEVFVAASHTHYLANATLTAAFATSVINTVVEHGNGGMVKLYISTTDEAAFRALTGFQAYLDPRIALGTGQVANQQRLNITRLDNRAIGIYGAAEVWVKPWMIANYLFVFDESAEQKPLVLRTRDGSGTDLKVAADIALYPLQAQYMEDEFDFGVWNRTNGAIGYFAGGAYAVPAISG